jgi:sugar lactone lactonase YvrE
MAITLGTGDLLFEPVEGWEKLPAGWTLIDVAGLAVDAHDNVYLVHRGEHPVIAFDRDGNFIRSWGDGIFTKRIHGISIDGDGSVFIVDDGLHAVQKFTPEGELLMTLGTPNKPAPKWQGQPFNRPTHAVVSPTSGNIYVSDGYGNCRVHKFAPDGKHILSWGEPGIDPGQFIRPHNIVIDKDDRIYVADRENHRVQVFDSNGKFLTMWHNIHRPDGICLDAEGNFFVGELNGMPGVDDCPGLGHRVSIYNLQGKLLTRFGDAEEGEGPGQFIAPHSATVDSRGDLYIGDVPMTVRSMEAKSLRKFRRKR